MHVTRTRIGWGLAVVATGIALVAWPLATGAGVTLALAAVYAGLRAAVVVGVLLVLLLLVVAAHVDDAGDRSVDRAPGSDPPR